MMSWISEEGYKESLSKHELRKALEVHTRIECRRTTGGRYGFKGLGLASSVQREEVQGKVRKILKLRGGSETSEVSEVGVK